MYTVDLINNNNISRDVQEERERERQHWAIVGSMLNGLVNDRHTADKVIHFCRHYVFCVCVNQIHFARLPMCNTNKIKKGRIRK